MPIHRPAAPACDKSADPAACPADSAANCPVNRYLTLVFAAIGDVQKSLHAEAKKGTHDAVN